jgi:hypothetical protein
VQIAYWCAPWQAANAVDTVTLQVLQLRYVSATNSRAGQAQVISVLNSALQRVILMAFRCSLFNCRLLPLQ